MYFTLLDSSIQSLYNTFTFEGLLHLMESIYIFTAEEGFAFNKTRKDFVS